MLVTFGLWGFGVLTWSISQLPVWLRETLRMRGFPETMPLIVAVAVIYWSVYFIKPIRLFLGEGFATVFFGIANLGIAAGEWCLEHRWASLVIVIGLAGINMVQNDRRASEVAEVDSALLLDDLPPSAYTDPGFAQFLKANREFSQ